VQREGKGVGVCSPSLPCCVDAMLSRSSSSSSPSSPTSCLSTVVRWPLVVGLIVLVVTALFLPRVLRGVMVTLMELDATPRHAAVVWGVVVLFSSPVAFGYGVVVFTTGMIFGWYGFIIAYTASSAPRQHNTTQLHITHTLHHHPIMLTL
jgi:hypothetical protein